MKEKNILILCAGRRVELVQSFQKAARKLNVASKIVAADCTDTAPALYYSDCMHILPPIDDERYIDSIIEVCQNENISLIVPTIDTDLLLLAENKAYIEEQTNAKLLISDYEVVSICRDKRKTQQFLEKNGFLVPHLYTDEQLECDDVRFPLFIKPIAGSSSHNTFKVNDCEELALYQHLISDAIVQDYMEGEEYTVDVFLDFDGKVITVVPRLRMMTRSGEVSKGKIVKDADIIRDVTRLMQTLQPIGHITVQLMKTKRGIEYIEINPRFGGGAPMSIASGANSCENLYKLLMGQALHYNENYRDNIMFLRFDNSICLDEQMHVLNSDELEAMWRR